jgi:hypothetical protein
VIGWEEPSARAVHRLASVPQDLLIDVWSVHIAAQQIVVAVIFSDQRAVVIMEPGNVPVAIKRRVRRHNI